MARVRAGIARRKWWPLRPVHMEEFCVVGLKNSFLYTSLGILRVKASGFEYEGSYKPYIFSFFLIYIWCARR